jgi:hypothetical protein
MRVETFEQFLNAVFQPPMERIRDWYEEEEFEVDDETLTDWYVRLFSAPELLFERFSAEQLERGFGAMINCNFHLAASDLVWDHRVDLDRRLRLIASFYDLFDRFFRRQSFWYATNMWWDAVAYAYECGNAVRGRSEEETRLQDAMFDVLVRTLVIDSRECQEAALHGLGHLHHPAGGDAIAAYLARNPTLDPELREYAMQASLGRIQ